jgi:hypothetical protein
MLILTSWVFLRFKKFNHVAGGQLEEDRILREPAAHLGEGAG